MPVLTTSHTARRVMNRVLSASLLCVIPALGTSCQLERFFPEDVGNGAARLTVRNAAYLNTLVASDERCGFSAAAVNDAYVTEGEVGSVGSVTWTVTDCTLDFGPATSKEHPTDGFDFGDDCNGVHRHAFGKVTFSGTKTVKGVITGDASKPVIPLTNDAGELALEADLENYQTVTSASEASAIIQKGHLSLVSEIHLAQSASLGVCGVSTSEISITQLIVTDAVYTVDSGDRVFDTDVPVLDITAQLGNWEDKENFIEGTVTVWDSVVDIKDHVLDPDYDADTFDASYACNEDLLLPVSYECPDLKETVADGAARLVLNDIGNLVQAAVKDTRCGFASAGVTGNVRVTGDVGYEGGEAVYTIDSPCEIDLPADTFLSRNCLGAETKATGKGTIKGVMRQRGRVTGDPAQPIIPTSRDAVEITFDVSFNGWSVQSGTKTFKADAGGATGTMRPRLAKDASTGACSIPTPVVTFQNVVIKPGTKGAVVKDGLSMGVSFRAGELSAQVGDKDGDENRLDGTVVVDVLGEEAATFDVGGALDPDYDHADGIAAYACTPNLVVPQDDGDCSFDPIIAENAARLTIQTAGTLAKMINADDNCGFEDTLGVLLWPTEVVGDNGDNGSMTWDVADCAVDHDYLAELGNDCEGGVTYVEGGANFVDAGRTVRGERDKMLLDFVIDSIIPRDRNAVDINLRTVELTEFTTYAVAAGADEPAGILVIHNGTLSGVVQPALGNRADDPSTYDVPTPVARLSSIRLSGTASLFAQGKTFHFTINDAELLATNGSFLGAENALSGVISVDGKPHNLGNLNLNPAYNQAAFEETYMCTENLAGPVR